MATNDIEYLAKHHPVYLERVNRNYWINFILLSCDSAIFTFSLAMLSQDTILPFFVSQLTQSKTLVGLVPALFFLGFYLPQLLGAYLANGRATRKWIIFGIAVAERVGILFIALVAQFALQLPPPQTLILFFTAYTLFAITNGLIGPAYADYISKAIPRRRGLFYGVMYGLGGLIGFGSSWVARYFLDRYAFPANFQTLFWVGFAASFISPFIIAAFRETPLPETSAPQPLRAFLASIPGQVRQYPQFLRYLAARALVGLGLMGNAFYALYAIQKFELSSGSLGIFTMIILLAQSALGFVWGWLGDRFGYKMVLTAAAVCLGLEAVLALTAPIAELYFVIAFLIGGVYAATNICDPNIVFEIAPPHETSRFIGIANTLIAPVLGLAPLLGGALVDLGSYPALFTAVLIISLLAWVVIQRWLVEPRRSLNSRPPQAPLGRGGL